MNVFFEQIVLFLIVVFVRDMVDTYGHETGIIKQGVTFSTPVHGETTRHVAFTGGTSSSEDPYELAHIKDLQNVAHFGDAQHRGPNWYDDESTSNDDSDKFDKVTSSSSSSQSTSVSSSESSDASSFETKEERLATRVYRTCTTCPHDMLKKYKNMGIKWICAGYQRARRSFKSECMMRYRNCQDGTLFVKLSDHKCKKDPFHGRHFFYHYRT